MAAVLTPLPPPVLAGTHLMVCCCCAVSSGPRVLSAFLGCCRHVSSWALSSSAAGLSGSQDSKPRTCTELHSQHQSGHKAWAIDANPQLDRASICTCACTPATGTTTGTQAGSSKRSLAAKCQGRRGQRVQDPVLLPATNLFLGCLVVVAGQCQARLVQVQQGSQVVAWGLATLLPHKLKHLHTA